MPKNKALRFFYAGLFIILASLSWPPSNLSFLIWIGFIPLFFLERSFDKRSQRKLFIWGFFSFLGWNLWTTWWVYNSSVEGSIAAFVLNSVLMTIPLLIYHRLRFLKQKVNYLPFAFIWYVFEYFHFRWEGTWPWLTVGNVFSNSTSLIQWYQFFGTPIASLIILLVNELLFASLFKYIESRNLKVSRPPIIGAMVILLVITGLNFIPSTVTFKDTGKNILAIQPNYDAYTEKFDIAPIIQVQKMIKMSNENIDSNTINVLWPETAIVEDIDESDYKKSICLTLIYQWLKANPNITLISGINSYIIYPNNNIKPTLSARYSKERNIYYDVFNAAMLMRKDSVYQFYHKSKLVPGVEKMPYSYTLTFMEDLVIKNGGTGGSLGIQDTPSIFQSKYMKTAPIICYESIFPAFVANFVKKGADHISIITNDGWWGNTNGYKQHLMYARLRAIENQRYIYRAANTGESAFIDPKGNVLKSIEYGKEGVLKLPYFKAESNSFYTDHVAENEFVLVVLFFLNIIVAIISHIKSRKNAN